jgi:hypothetical protein
VFGHGDDTLFRILRHGTGDVDLRASTSVIIDVLFKGEVPVGPSNNLFLSGGIGPTFRDLNLNLTSNQSFFGGGVPRRSFRPRSCSRPTAICVSITGGSECACKRGTSGRGRSALIRHSSLSVTTGESAPRVRA